MTLKRKLGIAMGLVVGLAAGLIAVFGRSVPVIFDAKILRYEGTNHVVIQIENKSGSDLFYDCYGSNLLVSREQGFLTSHEVKQVTIGGLQRLPPSMTTVPRIEVVCLRRPSKLEAVTRWLLQSIGIRLRARQSTTLLDLPRENPPLP